MSLASPVVAAVRTALVVTIVSVLVWIVAEGESLSTDGLEVRVVIAAERGEPIVIEPESQAGWDGRVFVELGGSTTAVTRAADRLRDGLRLAPGDPGVPDESGLHTLDLAEILRMSDALAGTAVTVRSVEPESVSVVVERLETREIDVAVLLPEAAQASAVVADPRRVRLTFPASAAEAVGAGLTASALVTPEQLASLSVGSRVTVRDVPLAVPEELDGLRFVRLEPSTVSVIATIDTRTDSVTLDAVPVQIQRPAFQADRWVVRVNTQDQLLSGVVVSGPSELIGPIRSGEVPVFATVVLTPDDLDRRVTEKEIRFSSLPTPLRFESPKPTVRLTIERVAEAP